MAVKRWPPRSARSSDVRFAPVDVESVDSAVGLRCGGRHPLQIAPDVVAVEALGNQDDVLTALDLTQAADQVGERGEELARLKVRPAHDRAARVPDVHRGSADARGFAEAQQDALQNLLVAAVDLVGLELPQLADIQ